MAKPSVCHRDWTYHCPIDRDNSPICTSPIGRLGYDHCIVASTSYYTPCSIPPAAAKPAHSVDNLFFFLIPGFHYFKYLLDPTQPECIQYAREHEEGDRECSILCRLRRRLYLRPTALGYQARAAVSQRTDPRSC